MQSYVWYVVLPLLFLAYSVPLFLRVYATTEMVIDEEFHLRQGLHFCNKRFDVVSKANYKFLNHIFILNYSSGIPKSPHFLACIYSH